MIASFQIKNYIKGKEALRLQKYNDGTGNFAIGYGHTWSAQEPETITMAQAELLFEQDVFLAEQAIISRVKIPLLQREFDALVSLIFNIGNNAFDGSTILLYLQAGNKIDAASYIPRYCHSGKTALAELLIRRFEEGSIFMGIPVAGY
jgi:lysozyme